MGNNMCVGKPKEATKPIEVTKPTKVTIQMVKYQLSSEERFKLMEKEEQNLHNVVIFWGKMVKKDKNNVFARTKYEIACNNFLSYQRYMKEIFPGFQLLADLQMSGESLGKCSSAPTVVGLS